MVCQMERKRKMVCSFSVCEVENVLSCITHHVVCCAEFNAIVSAFRYRADLTSATLYTTGVPCARCATTIVQSGIKTVVHGWKQQQGSGQASQQDEMEKETKEIFYWAKVATL